MQPRICSFLESTTVEARISAGEALMILHEIGVENIDDEFQFRFLILFFIFKNPCLFSSNGSIYGNVPYLHKKQPLPLD